PLHARRAELLGDVAHGFGVGGRRPGPRQPPSAVGLLERDLVVAQVELEAGHVPRLEGEHGFVAKLGDRPRGVAQDRIADDEDRRLARLARVHPHAGRALGAEDQAQALAVLQRERRLRGRAVEPEIAERFRISLDLAVHAGGDDRRDRLVDGPAVAARVHGGENLPAVALALELDGGISALELYLGDVGRLDREDTALASFRLLALRPQPDLVDVVERAERDEDDGQDCGGLPAHRRPDQFAAGRRETAMTPPMSTSPGRTSIGRRFTACAWFALMNTGVCLTSFGRTEIWSSSSASQLTVLRKKSRLPWMFRNWLAARLDVP